MKYFLLIACSLLLPFLCISQSIQQVLQSPIQWEETNSEADIIPLFNYDSSNVCLLIKRKTTIDAMMLNKHLQLTGKQSMKLPTGFYSKDIIGGIVKQNSCILYMFDQYRNDIHYITFDFENNNSYYHQYSIESNTKSHFIQAVTYDSSLCMLMVPYGTPAIEMYQLSYDGYEKKVFDLWGHKFTSEGNRKSLYNTISPHKKQTFKIPEVTYNSFGLSHHTNKLYQQNNKLYLTIEDQISHSTQVIELDLQNGIAAFQKYDFPEEFDYTNSFLYKKHLFRIASNNHEMRLVVNSLDNQSIVQQFTASKKGEISFKNTPVIEIQDLSEELKHTKHFFKKLHSPSIGISVYETNANTLEVTIGANETNDLESVASAYTYNPMYADFKANKTLHASYIKSLLSIGSFSHIRNELLDNSIVKLSHSIESIGLPLYRLGETLFKLKDDYIYGYYDGEDKAYHLLRVHLNHSEHIVSSRAQ
ncbi:hypothetical protein V6R21_27055 [Limibacter armeniacum]|uniref:hypothetical protein n=1 Tax=Limibacter armeniacum TaxID=466084 RepID=UPI002FE692AB